jgi:hypothetical protein
MGAAEEQWGREIAMPSTYTLEKKDAMIQCGRQFWVD